MQRARLCCWLPPREKTAPVRSKHHPASRPLPPALLRRFSPTRDRAMWTRRAAGLRPRGERHGLGRARLAGTKPCASAHALDFCFLALAFAVLTLAAALDALVAIRLRSDTLGLLARLATLLAGLPHSFPECLSIHRAHITPYRAR